MIERHQGRALPARRHIGAAKIIDHINAGQLRQQRTIADLPGPVFLGAMQDGLAVKANQVDITGLQSSLVQQRRHRLGMGLGQDSLGIRNGLRHGRALRHAKGGIQRRAQLGAGGPIIGHRQAGAGAHNIDAIGVQQGGINPVQRGAAHQADDFRPHFHIRKARHLCYAACLP
jgi:hypothetical protein